MESRGRSTAFATGFRALKRVGDLPQATTYVATESTVIFTERYSSSASYTEVVTADGTLNTAGNGTANISSSTVGAKSQSDITVRPSVRTELTLEHMLLKE